MEDRLATRQLIVYFKGEGIKNQQTGMQTTSLTREGRRGLPVGFIGGRKQGRMK